MLEASERLGDRSVHYLVYERFIRIKPFLVLRLCKVFVRVSMCPGSPTRFIFFVMPVTVSLL
jgi:hypothetical protein